MRDFKIFITEDDKWYAELLKHHMSLNPEYEVRTFETGAALQAALHEQPALVTLDYGLPDIKGDKLLQDVKSVCPDSAIVIISGQEDVNTAVTLLREGAYDYIVKDEEAKDRLWNIAVNVRQNQSLKERIEVLTQEVENKYDFSNSIIGTSEPMQKLFNLLEKAVQSNINVSITGETGTGKEVVAKAIHYNSKNSKEPFVAINVSAIPEELIESELFGHEKGAFTGAAARRIGKFEEAGKGTIFLDEMGEMSHAMQAKLLRVLQERELVRLGGSEQVKVQCRVIAATHKNLQDEVQAGNFRQDLYYRLLGLPIELPPLRSRKKDILLLANHFITMFCKENRMDKKVLDETAIDKLMSHPYPGNVRELKAVIDLAVVLSNENTIVARDITFQNSDPMSNLLGEECSLREYNYKILNHFLDKYDRNVLKVAKVLEIGKSTIYRMLKEEEHERIVL